jgi:hypothetical protein
VPPRAARRLSAGLAAAALSGAPSTLHAVLTGGDALAAARAAGSMLSRRHPLAAAVPVHLGISLFWAALIPRRAGVLGGALCGVGIAALDLGVLARPFPEIRALPLWPQIADHALFGAIVGYYGVRSCNATSATARTQDLP